MRLLRAEALAMTGRARFRGIPEHINNLLIAYLAMPGKA
jgi:hypothetical protein